MIGKIKAKNGKNLIQAKRLRTGGMNIQKNSTKMFFVQN